VRPWRLQVDLCGPYVAAGGYTYVCTAICSFTKFVVAWPIRYKCSITVARGLVDRVFLPFGTPRLLLTDNGKEFENELCFELCRLLDIEKQRTTFYRPQCNGGIERWHSTMHSMLAKVVDVHQKDWHVRLPFVVAAYNSSVHETTKFTPNFLFFGRELGAPVDVVLGNPLVEPRSRNDYAAYVVDMMTDAYEQVRAHLGRAAETAKRYYDTKAVPVTFEIGDKVWVFSPPGYNGRTRKWQLCYTGPFEVIKQVNAVNYVVRKSPHSKPLTVHVSKLKLCYVPNL